ncbi:MAG: ABC transporter ATP-binding protein [Chloroflexia bacterium]|nr:ABC transporter ATP-binding protein [Chloroflexia bacterium]
MIPAPNQAPPVFAPDEAVAMLGITKRFGSVVANDAISFVARKGEVHALIGENGAGKSTLMSILAGFYRPDAGELRIGGQPVTFRSPGEAIEAGIGMVYQHFMLVDSFTVAENIVLGLPCTGITLDLDEAERQLVDVSTRYGLGVDPKARIWQLSVGEQQRVEILRLLIRGATTLVFDEPTAVLTPQESADLIQTMRALAAEGFCVIFISHKLGEVEAVADRITVLRHGSIVDTLDAGAADRRALARMMVGRELAAVLLDDGEVDGAGGTGDVILAVEALTALGDKRLPALRGVSFGIRAGETFGIAGVAGNGQRELAEVITGLRPATGGTVTLRGEAITNAHPRTIARAGVAHVPEDRLGAGLVGPLDLASNAILRTYRRNPIARGPMLVKRAIDRFADRLISEHEVNPADHSARLRDLSGGNQQKLLIARELAGEPAAIVAVHPTRGVDVGASEAIHGVLRAQRARGVATLLISEDLDELIALCDRIAVIYEGQLMGTVTPREAEAETLGLMMAGTPLDDIRQPVSA